MITEARCYFVALKMEEEAMSQGMLEKLRKQILPQKLQKENDPEDTLILAQLN